MRLGRSLQNEVRKDSEMLPFAHTVLLPLALKMTGKPLWVQQDLFVYHTFHLQEITGLGI